MPTTLAQRDAFLMLKHNTCKNECWEDFLKEWDGFMSAIISRKLYFAASLWDDAKLEAEAKLYRYIEGFDESREISPWLSRVITSACEDVKKSYGYRSNQLRGRQDEALDATCDSRQNTAIGSMHSSRQGTVTDVSHNRRPHTIADAAYEASDFVYDDEWLGMMKATQKTSDTQLIEDMWCCVNTALDSHDMDMRKKTAFILFYRYDYKLRDIAKHFHLEQSTVNNWPGAVLKRIMPQVKREMRELGYATDVG